MPGTSERLEKLAARIRVCVKCPLCQSRTVAVPGDGAVSSRFMIIGEAPGKEEDKTGHPFVGSSGRYLDKVLAGTGIERGDFFITNMVKCRPPSNRTPKAGEVEICTSTYLFEQIALIEPELILLLGSVAAKKMLGLKTVEEGRGKVLEAQSRKFIVTYHPAARFYREDLAAKIEADFGFLKRELGKLRG